MGFREGAWAKVWAIEDKGNFHNVRITTRKKNKNTGEQEQDFGDFVRLIGTAHKLAEDIQVGDSIKLGSCEVTNSYNKDTKKSFVSYAVFSFEKSDSSGEPQAESGNKSNKTTTNATFQAVDSDEDLPF